MSPKTYQLELRVWPRTGQQLAGHAEDAVVADFQDGHGLKPLAAFAWFPTSTIGIPRSDVKPGVLPSRRDDRE